MQALSALRMLPLLCNVMTPAGPDGALSNVCVVPFSRGRQHPLLTVLPAFRIAFHRQMTACFDLQLV